MHFLRNTNALIKSKSQACHLLGLNLHPIKSCPFYSLKKGSSLPPVYLAPTVKFPCPNSHSTPHSVPRSGHTRLWSLGDKVKSFQVSLQIPAWKSLAESISVLPSPNTGSLNTTHLSEDIFTMHKFKFCVSLPLTFAFSTSSNVKTLCSHVGLPVTHMRPSTCKEPQCVSDKGISELGTWNNKRTG